ncbi:hypothetical protein ACFL4L_01605 [bacterium]
MKKFFIVFGIILLVLIVAGVLFVGMNKDKILASSFAAIQPMIMQQLPDSVPADSAQVLFDKALLKVKNGETNPAAIQDFLMTFKSSMEDKQLDSLEIKILLDKTKAM